jgi:uncharacterized membrane protein YeaQ/YmgE (transglycosylase-associated protein family)
VVEAWLLFIVSGLLGGLASALIWAKSWQDLKAFDFFRAVVLGAIGGYVYFLLHSEWYLPNSVVAFVWGYAFKDFIEALVERVKLLFKLK